MIGCREGTDALAEVTDLDADIPQEGAAWPSSHDHDCLRVQFIQIEFHRKPWTNGMGAHLFVWESHSIFTKGKCAFPQWFCCHLRGGCCFLELYLDRVHWCVTCFSWVWVQSDDDFRPDVYRSEGCGCTLLCYWGVFNPAFLCAECQGYLIGHM